MEPIFFDENGLIVESGTGTAIFRYIKNQTKAHSLKIDASGKGIVTVYCDSIRVGADEIEKIIIL